MVKCAVIVSAHSQWILRRHAGTMTDQERLQKNALCDLLMKEGIDSRQDVDAVARTCLLTELAVELRRKDTLACALAWHEAPEKKGIRREEAIVLDFSRANAIAGERYGTEWQWEQATLARELYYLRRAVSHPKFTEIPDVVRCMCLNNLGNRLRVAGRAIEALECWRRALEVQPNFGMSLCNRARTLAAYAEALEDTGSRALFWWVAHKEASAALAPTATYTDVRDEHTKGEAKKLKDWIESALDVEGMAAVDPLTSQDTSATDEERDYRHWCLANCLYLSVGEDDQLGGRLRFGVFELDLRAGELRKHGLRIRLQEQPFQVLAMLLEHPGEVVTREELRKKLWPADIFVDFDHGLNKAINKVRDALSDSAESPRFVETVARRGYRFLAEVKVAEAASVRSPELENQPHPAAETRDRRDLTSKLTMLKHLLPSLAWKIAVFVLVLLMASLATWKLYSRNGPSPVIRSLAVLPLENLSGDASQDYFSDGMTDELITELGQISDLRVISRTSAMTYKGTHRTLPQIAQELNVDAVVEGAVLRSGDRVRITAQLIMAVADKQLWAKSYEGDLRDTLTLQSQVARAIAEEIRMELTPHEQAVLNNVNGVNPEAHEAYLKGRYFWNKRTADGLSKAIDYFNQAIERIRTTPRLTRG